MNDARDIAAQALPSAGSLWKAVLLALLAAAALLVLVVLPAEYGIDPTGVGDRLGLKAMSQPQAAPASADAAAAEADAEVGEPLAPAQPVEQATVATAEPASAADAVIKSAQAFRSDETALTLQPGEGAEVKASMQSGEPLFFSWVADAGVNFDMHGERPDAGRGEYTSYWKGRDETSAHGTFRAPFAGTHGWYWRNRGTAPVTVRVKTSGYYSKLLGP
jgi:hypothetical protein